MAVGASVTVGKNTFVLSKNGVVHVPIPKGYMPRVSEDLMGTAGEPELTREKMIFQKSPAAFVVVVVTDERWKPKELRVIRPTFDILVGSFARADIQLRPILWKLFKEIKDIDLDKMGEELNSAADQVVDRLDGWFTRLERKINDLMAEPSMPPKSGPATAYKPQAPVSPAAPAGRKPKSGAKSGSRRPKRR